jgi:Phosphoinositide phospholipase C, Ca2+-dependent
MTRVHIILMMAACFVLTALAAESVSDRLPMNQIQVIGSHNSYKEKIEPALFQSLLKKDRDRYTPLEYSHVAYQEQLNLGLRGLEIDVVYDPKGGMYAKPFGLEMMKQMGMTPAPYDSAGEMLKPGFKVIHVPDVDFRSHTYTLKESLRQLRAWSDAHPRHLPIAVTMNAKDVGADLPRAVQPLMFDAAAFDAWDAEIREVLPPQKLLTPDDVRGEFPTLEAAVRAFAWPALSQARGRFLFVLDETGPKMETYIKGHPSLKGRVMFVNALEGRPEAAFVIANDPIAQFHYIRKLVQSGHLVRTRADADTFEARSGDTSRLKAAIESGAQFISTDYYYPNRDFGTGYQVRLPGNVMFRWNPVLSPPLETVGAPE